MDQNRKQKDLTFRACVKGGPVDIVWTTDATVSGGNMASIVKRKIQADQLSSAT